MNPAESEIINDLNPWGENGKIDMNTLEILAKLILAEPVSTNGIYPSKIGANITDLEFKEMLYGKNSNQNNSNTNI